MHARAVPVGVAERLAVILDVDAVFLGQPLHQVAGHPHLVGGPLRALAEDLELPLALRHFGVDAFVVDAGGEADVEMLLDDLARDVADLAVADAGVIRALRRRIAGLGEAERTAVLVEEILLLEAEPGALVVEDGRALVRRMRRHAVRHHDLAQHEHAVLALAVGKDADRLQHAVRAAAFGLHGRAAVEAPQRQLLQRRKRVVFLDLRLAAEIGHRGVAVEPDVLELILCHCRPSHNLCAKCEGLSASIVHDRLPRVPASNLCATSAEGRLVAVSPEACRSKARAPFDGVEEGRSRPGC